MCKNASSHWQRVNTSRVNQDFLIPMRTGLRPFYARVLMKELLHFFNWCVKSNSLTRVLRSAVISLHPIAEFQIIFPSQNCHLWTNDTLPNSSTWRQPAFTPFLFSIHTTISRWDWVPLSLPCRLYRYFQVIMRGDRLAITWSAF